MTGGAASRPESPKCLYGHGKRFCLRSPGGFYHTDMLRNFT